MTMKLAHHTATADEVPCPFAKQVLLIVGSHHCGASHAVGRTDHLMGISGSGVTVEAEAVAVGGAGMDAGEVRDAPNAARIVNSVSVGLEGAGALAADGAVSGASTTLFGSVTVVSDALVPDRFINSRRHMQPALHKKANLTELKFLI